MRTFFHALLFAASFVVFCPLHADEHELEVVTVGNDKFIRWHGQAGRTYFIQVSDPNDQLRKWTWAPIIETGNDEVISYEVDGTADKGFFRLWFSDQLTNDPDGDDFDYDGLSNWDEVNTYQTNPLKWDSDDDGLPDGWEIAHGLDPNDDGSTDPVNGADGDPDEDGLPNLFEYWHSADPNLADTDSDGLNDFDEVFLYGTYPDSTDTDYDGLGDYAEIFTHGTNPWDWDSDDDTLDDGAELLTHGTNPLEIDTDGDWMWDDYEISNSLDPNDATDGLLDADSDTLANQLEFVFIDQGYDPFISDNAALFPWAGDHDWDGMTTQLEFVTHLTNPRQPDTDGDGYGDAWEIANGFNAKLNNRNGGPANHHPDADPDGDGRTNAQEEEMGTNPFSVDTDGDGVNDDVEDEQGSNPNDPSDKLPPPNGTVPATFTFGDHSASHSEKYRLQLTPLEGDTGGVRYRTNRNYGQPQKGTFRLPKGAKYKVEIIHIGTNPKYRGSPRPDYDYQLEIDEDANCLVVDDPDDIMGYHNESDLLYAAGRHSTLYVPLFKMKEVSFSASTVGFLTDDGTANIIGDIDYVTYDAPHWQDGNDDGDADDTDERKYPIAYVRNTAPTIAGKIKVKPSGLTAVSGFSAKIKVIGPGNIKIDTPVAATLGTDELELPPTASAGNFVDEIDYLNPMTLSWEVEVNGKGHWCEAGETSNRTYVTLDVPVTALRQETLFDLGCRNADGASLIGAARDAMFGEFTDQHVRRLDGVQMTYWKNNQMGCTDTPDLLQRPDGNGNCQSWSGLFRDILRTHGIAADRIRVWPKNNDTSVIVKNWAFTSPPSGPPNHPYVVGEDATDLLGIAAQGNPDPPGSFNGHWITKSGGFYYDSSYGTPPVKLVNIDKNYEDAAFSGFGARYELGTTTFTGIRLNDIASPASEVDYFLAN